MMFGKNPVLSTCIRPVNRRAFTLIELLVVIAIIAILAAILFPVFAQAREKARGATCLSNLKQIGLAIMQYTQDYDETYPLNLQPNSGKLTTWHVVVSPYIKNGTVSVNAYQESVYNAGVWQCPSAPSTPAEPKQTLYIPHGGMFGCTSDISWVCNGQGSASLAALSHPADIVMVGESVPDPTGGSAENMIAQFSIQAGSNGEIEGDAAAAPDAELGPNWENYWAGFKPRYRHTKTSTILFADGHAKAMPKGRLNVCRNFMFGGMFAGTDWSGKTADQYFQSGQPCAGYEK